VYRPNLFNYFSVTICPLFKFVIGKSNIPKASLLLNLRGRESLEPGAGDGMADSEGYTGKLILKKAVRNRSHAS